MTLPPYTRTRDGEVPQLGSGPTPCRLSFGVRKGSRISSFAPTPDMSFNQFLIADEHPALIHTGMYPMYEDVRQAVAEILDPTRLE